MQIRRLDHVVLTVNDIERSVDFYTGVLGMREQRFEGGRRALRFGDSKINLHEAGHEFEPKALRPAPGTADFCLIVAEPLDQVMAELVRHGVPIADGPRPQTGALGPMVSIYVRDPDQNLVELARYD